jgi:indole-3-glycerol phosphate synthase
MAGKTDIRFEDILEHKRREVEELKRLHRYIDFEKRITRTRPGYFERTLKGAAFPALIAEIKKASPSAGVLCDDFNPLSILESYEDMGAAAVSVLTDERFFQGSLSVFEDVRRATDLPLLRKDFILDEMQVLESAAAGADAFLLITAALEDRRLSKLMELGKSAGCSPLVEVHTEDELKRALDAGAGLIGVNNRNLKTFEVSLEVSLKLLPLVPDGLLRVSESGIRFGEEIRRLRDAGADAFLIGTSLVASPDRRRVFREMLHEN